MSPIYTKGVACQHDLCYILNYDQNMVEEPKDRLRRARLQAGFRSAAEAARHFGWPYSTYAAHENGQNAIRVENANIYSPAFKVAASWILTGEGGPATVSVPVEGYVGAGFVIMPFSESQEIERIEVPAGMGNGLRAVRVRGNSMQPAYYNGDVIFYSPEADGRPPRELLGRECVVKTHDGHIYVKRLLKGSREGRFVLASYNSDPLVDKRVDWACPVKYIQRA